MLITELLAGLSMTAKAALGLGVAASAVTAGAAVLPDDAGPGTRPTGTTLPVEVGEETTTTVAEDPTTTTVVQEPTTTTVVEEPTTTTTPPPTTVVDVPPTTTTVVPDEDGEGTGPRKDNFGARVSEDARDGGVDGPTIAAEAREKQGGGGKAPEAPAPGVRPDRPTGQPADRPVGPPEGRGPR